MRLVIKDKNKVRINKVFEWLLHMVGYTVVFIGVTSLFKSIYINMDYFLLWPAITVLLIYILNKTIKPILVTLTIPITGLTLGLFYPCINVLILKLVDWLLGPYFEVKDLFIAFFVAILLSITNFIMEEIIKNMINKVKKNG